MRQVAELLDRPVLGERARVALGFAAPTQDIRDISTAFVNLQNQRHWADYNPMGRVTKSDASDLVEQAELAIEALDRLADGDRKNLLVFLMTSART